MSRQFSVYKSEPVYIGSIPLGGNNPVRIQSMTNTDTLDTAASVAQCIRIIEAGADYVRLTAQGIREAENLAEIKKEIRKAGYDTPLIADIHFNPAAAEKAAAIVEKVRINPGNYADRRTKPVSSLSEKEYNLELERIHQRLLPLIRICRDHGTAVRIGVNHGSLSERILDRYGNTPEGMAVSAMEFIRIFTAENFTKLVLSMKSSDIAVMVSATRLLVEMMTKNGLAFPLHLGVTEAGEGEDGRVRSAAGIGALLSEGIGDTIRVSLSEDPEKEIPVAKKIADLFPRNITLTGGGSSVEFSTRRNLPAMFGKVNGPLVAAVMTRYDMPGPLMYREAGYEYDEKNGKITATDQSADLLIVSQVPENIPEGIILVVPYKLWQANRHVKNLFPLFSPETLSGETLRSDRLNVVFAGPFSAVEPLAGEDPATTLLIFTWDADNEREAPLRFAERLRETGKEFPVVLNPVFSLNSYEELQVKAPALLGRFFAGRPATGISISNRGDIPFGKINNLCFSILQCTGLRITRTVYISCPTCGRTKFNLQDAIKKVKEKTSHLRGLKIAVMGCIVNGPGEMAGADWGYVGAAPGRVHIYKGSEPLLRNVDESVAAGELLRLIEEDQASR